MLTIFCHDETCRGHAELAGRDPHGSCRFCGHALADALGGLIVEKAREEVVATDLNALEVCSAFGHVFEGVYDVAAGHFRGRCSRCAVAIALNAS